MTKKELKTLYNNCKTRGEVWKLIEDIYDQQATLAARGRNILPKLLTENFRSGEWAVPQNRELIMVNLVSTLITDVAEFDTPSDSTGTDAPRTDDPRE